MLGISRWEVYGIALLAIILAAGGWGLYQKHEGRVEGRAEIQVQFDAFKNKVEAAGVKAEADKLAKEKEDAKRISDATTERDLALSRMRAAEAAASAARRRVPLTPTAAGSGGQICFDQKALSAAVEQYRGSVRGLAESGDETALDARALIQSWPTSKGKSP